MRDIHGTAMHPRIVVLDTDKLAFYDPLQQCVAILRAQHHEVIYQSFSPCLTDLEWVQKIRVSIHDYSEIATWFYIPRKFFLMFQKLNASSEAVTALDEQFIEIHRICQNSTPSNMAIRSVESLGNLTRGVLMHHISANR